MSKVTEVDIEKLANEIDEYWWAKNKSKYLK